MGNGIAYRNVIAELKRTNTKQETVASFLKITPGYLNRKLQGRAPFRLDEFVSIRDEFLPDSSLDYLVEKSV
jgi:hypothetical protein